MRRLALVLSLGLSMAGGAPAFAETTAPMAVETPVVIGQSYALPSAVMNQTREINVWLPPGYAKGSQTYPVLYVLDGGQDQDFHHISGIAQLGTIVGTTRDVAGPRLGPGGGAGHPARPRRLPPAAARRHSAGTSRTA